MAASNSYATARDNFFHWALKWFYNQPASQDVTSEVKPLHLTVLVALLQSVGFSLKFLETVPGNEEETLFNVSITCPRSSARALLTSNKQEDMNRTDDYEVPRIPAGIARFSCEILSYITSVLSENMSLEGAEVERKCESTAPLQGNSQVASSMAGSSEQQDPSSPLLSGNMKIKLLREKTWSMSSLADLDDVQLSNPPPHTSSPKSTREENPDLLARLQDITAQLQDLMKEVGKKKVERHMPAAELKGKEKAASLPRSSTVKRVQSPACRFPMTDKRQTPTPQRSGSRAVKNQMKATSLISLTDSQTRASPSVKARTSSMSSTNRRQTDLPKNERNPSQKATCRIPKPETSKAFNLHYK